MGQLVFQATLGGQVNLVGPNTASTFNINVPAVAGNMVTTGDTGTVTNTMLASSAYTAPGTIGSGTANTGAFTTLTASSTITGTKLIPTGTSVTGNGMYLPAANTLGFSTNGTLAAVIDANQNVGVGVTPSAWNSIFKSLDVGTTASFVGSSGGANVFNNAYYNGTDYIYKTTAAATRYLQSSGAHQWFNAPSGTAGNAISFTQAMTLDASGNLGVGVTSPASKLDVSSASTGVVKFTTSGGKPGWLYSDSAGIAISDTADLTKNGLYINNTSNYVAVYTGSTGAERARIDSSGNLLVGTTITGNALAVYKLNNDVINSYTGQAAGTSRSLYTGWYGATSSTQGTLSFNVTSNGNVTNANNSYGSLSDIKLKENITDATPKLEKLCQVRVVNYNFKEGQTHKQIGVIAQELEQVFPSMIEEAQDRDEEGNDLGTTTKSVKYSVFVPMLIKAIQEQQALIQSLTDRLTALEGAAK